MVLQTTMDPILPSSRQCHVLLPLPPPLPLLFSSFSKTHRWRVQVGLESLSHFLTPHFGAFSITLGLGQFPLLIISVLISLSLQITGLNFACLGGLTFGRAHGKTTIIIFSCFLRLVSSPSHIHPHPPALCKPCWVCFLSPCSALDPLNLFMIFHIQGVPFSQSLG